VVELRREFGRLREEAQAYFGNGAMYVEQFCEQARHVEIQVLFDHHGEGIALGDRECSIQRRHQKLLEECPSPAIPPSLRASMQEAALALCRIVPYQNVGTVEFLVDQELRFYFLEMNTRIQVEHPVTEMVTGIDLVKEQIFMAAGERLRVSPEDVRLSSHAVECRINAENPVTFAPSPGKITGFHMPGGFGVRVDSFIYSHYEVLPYYDSLLAKVIAHAPTRGEALLKMQQALDECVIEGVQTTIPFHKKLLSCPEFVKGEYHTQFVENGMSLHD
jgi:acetyl-CoA carboxylase biotin carboxylase subunit